MKRFTTLFVAIAMTFATAANFANACEECGEVKMTEDNEIKFYVGNNYVCSKPLPRTLTVTRVVRHRVCATGSITRVSRSGHAAQITLSDGNCNWVCNTTCCNFEEEGDCKILRYDVYLSDGRFLPCGVVVVDGCYIPCIDPPKVDWNK